MNGVKRVWLLLALLATMDGCMQTATAQVATTTVQDTVYTATGAPASGTVDVSWGAFTTAGGTPIPAGTTSVTLGTGGALSIALAPNAGGTPMGSYYTAVFHLSDGSTSKQYWVIPVTVPGGGPAKLAAIENSVLPTSVAMQTVSKQYVDNAIAQAQISPVPLDSSPYVLKAGDTMSGPLVLPADPVSPQQAADKHYVDENIASVSGGLGGTVHTLPTATQTVVQPSGTQLGVSILNGELYASQYVSGAGGNGIANALASSDCASGCKVVAEPNYGSEPVSLGSEANGTVVEDQRGGADGLLVINPLADNTSYSAARSIVQLNTLTQQQLNALRPGSLAIGATAEELTTVGLTGGTNLYPAEIEAPPYFKSTYGVLALDGIYNTQGQHIQLSNAVNCYGVGDCLAGSQIVTSSGGYRDNSDEGAHPYDLEVVEDTNVFNGTCTTGCTAGSTTVAVTATSGGGTQGDGRFLADTAASKTISTGAIIGGGKTIFGTAHFSGTSFPVSVFLATAQAATSQATNVAPGTVTLPIATTGVPTGFATSTAALPASSGTACVADMETTTSIPNYEMAPYTVVDATHLQLTLNKAHKTSAAVAVGGLCGYGLDQTVDDVGAIKQVFPVIGSMDATDLYYADADTTEIGGASGGNSTSGYANVSLNVASIARSGNVVTVTTTGAMPQDVNGLTMTVSGVADSSYNGSYAVSTTGSNTLTYANSGPNSTSSGGTLSLVTGGYNLYPIAEVLSVANPANHSVDGTFVLAPNTVAWAAGDSVQEPHYYQQNTAADIELVTQYVPRPQQFVQAGKWYEGNVVAGMRGWQVTNTEPASYYFGGGGTHNLPDDGYVVSGPWRNDFEVDAGSGSIIYAHCNVNGCNRWDSGYDLFLLESAVGFDNEQYQPESSTVSWALRGTPYSFSPTAFTAGTINVGTLNATTINGGVSGSAITSGTISASVLPVFGPSGTSHAAGIVPDPGATAGATRYLREDGTWDVPAGGSGGSSGSPSGSAGGDLSGSYPNPTVAAVHATSGTMDGVTIGGTTPAAAKFSTLETANSLLVGTSTAISVPGVGSATNSVLGPSGTDIAAFASAGTNTALDLFNTSSSGTLRLLAFTDGNAYMQASGDYIFASAGSATPRVRISAAGTLSVGPSASFQVDVNGDVKAAQYVGPTTAPTGACSTSGAWVFSQDGHATFCASGTWVTKI